jgi:hypothetical protein
MLFWLSNYGFLQTKWMCIVKKLLKQSNWKE